jgi:hypothetical protein
VTVVTSGGCGIIRIESRTRTRTRTRLACGGAGRRRGRLSGSSAEPLKNRAHARVYPDAD